MNREAYMRGSFQLLSWFAFSVEHLAMSASVMQSDCR